MLHEKINTIPAFALDSSRQPVAPTARMDASDESATEDPNES